MNLMRNTEWKLFFLHFAQLTDYRKSGLKNYQNLLTDISKGMLDLGFQKAGPVFYDVISIT